MKSILVIAAHPDDEILGCAGTIAKHIKAGDQVNTLILSEGVTSRAVIRDREKAQDELSVLAHAAHKAGEILGVTSTKLEGFPDNRMDSCDLLDVVKSIETSIHTFLPEIIYTHHGGDLNIDHRVIHEAVMTACRPLPGQSVKSILFFEIPSSTEWQLPFSAPTFTPNWYVNISDTLHLKLEALMAYESEMREWPHPRSLKAVEYLSRWRGTNVGVEAAEAFILGRRLEN
ncbi:PIG-L deacetylase family protein [Acaryochloris sp. CCMEE 5410]|uniref:PIG-L deacetylase family protein n=1 Tax=Acaryochloris sp. CCMEE 5410 TaxID=310037 RepID=UPI00024841C9|nr:PIG-L family deacetylase [Acaryochloris sp. CCMEE 5410]KAI9135237.1 PIG-L family deacetylase [Acaryochloris sp. CCMEE 5410]